MTGRFITLEGGEGVGKSTQLAALAAALRARGISVVTTREPGGTAGAEAIRALLMTGEADKWIARTEACLFTAARADHIFNLIAPALHRGDWVICDRYIDSTVAYQGFGGGMGAERILDMHRACCDNLMPDRTLLFTLPLEQAHARAVLRDDGKADRFGAMSADYHQRVVRAFHNLARAEPQRIYPIDASGTPEEVTERLLAALTDLL